MEISDDLKKWTDTIKEHWTLLIQLAFWITAIITGFMLQPPVSKYEDLGAGFPKNYAQFIVAICVGLIFIATQKWNKKSDLKIWVVLTIFSLFISASAAVSYQYLVDTWTCKFESHPIIIGNAYSEIVLKNEVPETDCSTMLGNFGGNAELAWNLESIKYRRVILQLTYILSLPFFTICLISILQAIHCSTQEDDTRKMKIFYSGIWAGESTENKITLNLQLAGNNIEGNLVTDFKIVPGDDSKPIIPGSSDAISSSEFREGSLFFSTELSQERAEYRMTLTDDIDVASLEMNVNRLNENRQKKYHWQISRIK